jgi:hypothetical protein
LPEVQRLAVPGVRRRQIALIEGVVNGLIEKRSLTTKAAEEVKRVLRSVDWLKVAKKRGGLALTAFTGIPLVGLDDLVASAVDYVKFAICWIRSGTRVPSVRPKLKPTCAAA